MEPAGDDDWTMLRRYAHERDEAAFAQVVRRHLNAVFSAATRRVGGDRHLAEEVTQAVFIILASKAKGLCARGGGGNGSGAMSAWLLKCVRYAAANAVKMEARRQKHHDAFARRQQHAGACSANPSDVLVWHEVARQIDDAVLKLPAADREAVLLRYFEDRGIAEIAARMRTTEGAVKQRLSRAVERLRQRLSRRGAAMLSTIDASAFAAMLASHVVTTAPPGLGSATVAAAAVSAVSGVAGVTLGTSIAKGAMTMMMWTKTVKFAAATVAVILLCGAGGIIAVKSASAADKTDPPAAAAKESDTKKDADDEKAVSLKNAPPVVVRTVPESGASDVDASIKEITVSYSKEMQNGSWSWSTWGEENFPKTTGKPHYKDDKRTCVLPVELKPGKTYAIWLNSENFGNFKDKSGHAAVPYLLIFETKK
jgi:RNA polymerase sigma factor (sigma-70 family)